MVHLVKFRPMLYFRLDCIVSTSFRLLYALILTKYILGICLFATFSAKMTGRFLLNTLR